MIYLYQKEVILLGDSMNNIDIVPVSIENLDEAKNVVCRGLTEYFGYYDLNLNPDLNDILSAYSKDKGVFLVALEHGKVIGTGALIKENVNIVRVVRMSVLKEYRRYGIASKVLFKLEDIASERGYEKIVLETTKTWESAKSFYVKNGYVKEREDEEDVHYFKVLSYD